LVQFVSFWKRTPLWVVPLLVLFHSPRGVEDGNHNHLMYPKDSLLTYTIQTGFALLPRSNFMRWNTKIKRSKTQPRYFQPSVTKIHYWNFKHESFLSSSIFAYLKSIFGIHKFYKNYGLNHCLTHRKKEVEPLALLLDSFAN